VNKGDAHCTHVKGCQGDEVEYTPGSGNKTKIPVATVMDPLKKVVGFSLQSANHMFPYLGTF
jgi:hypothetical protein